MEDNELFFSLLNCSTTSCIRHLEAKRGHFSDVCAHRSDSLLNGCESRPNVHLVARWCTDLEPQLQLQKRKSKLQEIGFIEAFSKMSLRWCICAFNDSNDSWHQMTFAFVWQRQWLNQGQYAVNTLQHKASRSLKPKGLIEETPSISLNKLHNPSRCMKRSISTEGSLLSSFFLWYCSWL